MIEIADPSRSYAEFPGPIVLLAGPGTGKTYQLAHRVRHLIRERQASANQVAVITFTTAAARHMREELRKPELGLTPEEIPEIITTMHSLGNMIVGTQPTSLGLPDPYQVLNTDSDRLILFEDAARLAGISLQVSKEAEICRRHGNCSPSPNGPKCRVCEHYLIILRKCSLVDYDDQIFLACRALREDANVAAQWRRRTRYLLVDEYQDINQAQCEFIQLLSSGQEDGLFVAGDDDQSIYSFRGGNPRYISDFETYYGPSAKIGRLEMSWRCPEHILRGAKAMLQRYFPGSVPKPDPAFSPTIQDNNKIVFHNMPSETREASRIAQIASDRIKHGNVIVIIPNSKYFPPIRKALQAKGLPYSYRWGMEDRGIVRFALLADWADDMHDNLSLRSLLECIVHSHDELIRSIPSSIASGIQAKREAALGWIARLWNRVQIGGSLYDALAAVGPSDSGTDFLHAVRTEYLDPMVELLVNRGTHRVSLKTFLEQSAILVAPGQNPTTLISEVRELRRERAQSGLISSYPPIAIYNMPSSKGLQGEFVFVVGVSEGIFPSPDGDIEEQSRLFYVTMTRARRELHLFSARKRPGSITLRGQSFQLRQSPFVSAIPSEHIDTYWIRSDGRRQSND